MVPMHNAPTGEGNEQKSQAHGNLEKVCVVRDWDPSVIWEADLWTQPRDKSWSTGGQVFRTWNTWTAQVEDNHKGHWVSHCSRVLEAHYGRISLLVAG